MNWTAETPTEEGYYFAVREGCQKPEIVYVYNGSIYGIGTSGALPEWYCAFSDKIELPVLTHAPVRAKLSL